MAASNQRPTNSSDRPHYPKLAEEIGEDPARYLHDPDMTTWARIRGINSQDVLDAWFEVETDLGPRREVIKRLNAQREELESKQRGDQP